MTGLPRENVQPYPRPPALEPVPQRIIIRLGGVLVADTAGALRALETHHAPTRYLPPKDITATLRPVRGSNLCKWKGIARYFDVLSGDRTAPRAAWASDRPTTGFAGFGEIRPPYATQMNEAYAGDTRATPQPRDFYSSWVTPNLDGQIKDAPETTHW